MLFRLLLFSLSESILKTFDLGGKETTNEIGQSIQIVITYRTVILKDYLFNSVAITYSCLNKFKQKPSSLATFPIFQCLRSQSLVDSGLLLDGTESSTRQLSSGTPV